ncbi:uncharacterized protein LOC122363461 [Amphibalanus amphitrite]|uniref:uncharacterized protein LOC122363461 n=1 Tax=Amphibalanus amphitrite TaxID=1232801 RepID=UPI001C929D0E|nr:uncharacterized protein LOC122363461 [Amphibalanus amphitrite]
MASDLSPGLLRETFQICHERHMKQLQGFVQCLCENSADLCRSPAYHTMPTAVTATTPGVTTSSLAPSGPTASPSPFVPTDWTRSYSVTAGLCALFLAMCAVIIVLRIMSKRNEPQSQNRVSVATVPVPDSEPPPYDVVVRLPPSYISREPPPYCEIDVDKYPSPLICPRVPGNVRSVAGSSASLDTEGSTSSGASSSDRQRDSCGDLEAASGDQTAESHASASSAAAGASPGAVASSCDISEDSAAAATPSCDVAVVSEVRDVSNVTSRGGEGTSR